MPTNQWMKEARTSQPIKQPVNQSSNWSANPRQNQASVLAFLLPFKPQVTDNCEGTDTHRSVASCAKCFHHARFCARQYIAARSHGATNQHRLPRQLTHNTKDPPISVRWCTTQKIHQSVSGDTQYKGSTNQCQVMHNTKDLPISTGCPISWPPTPTPGHLHWTGLKWLLSKVTVNTFISLDATSQLLALSYLLMQRPSYYLYLISWRNVPVTISFTSLDAVSQLLSLPHLLMQCPSLSKQSVFSLQMYLHSGLWSFFSRPLYMEQLRRNIRRSSISSPFKYFSNLTSLSKQ